MKSRSIFLISLTLWYSSLTGQTQSPPSGLVVTVLKGDGGENSIKPRTGTAIEVEVRDDQSKLVPGAQVIFQLPSFGPSGSFPGGTLIERATSGPDGHATMTGFVPNDIEGQFLIKITADSGALHGTAVVSQVNIAKLASDKSKSHKDSSPAFRPPAMDGSKTNSPDIADVLARKPAAAANQSGAEENPSSYTLGPGDEVTVAATDVEEFKGIPARVDMQGNVRLPLIGKVHAAGLTPAELESAIKRDLKVYVKEPDVIVTVMNFRSQPVMILGAVNSPGTHQLEGRKTLFEVLSEVGGVRPDAGHTILITRKKEWGPIPLPGCTEDATGQFYVAEVSIRSVTDATNPVENILVKPRDVITVPKGQVIYVVGAVKKSGGYPLGEAQSMTVLQALAMADGLDKLSAPGHARIMRVSPGGTGRTEIPVDVKKIFDGKGNDVALGAEDILFIPTSGKKTAAMRGVETAIGLTSTLLLLGLR